MSAPPTSAPAPSTSGAPDPRIAIAATLGSSQTAQQLRRAAAAPAAAARLPPQEPEQPHPEHNLPSFDTPLITTGYPRIIAYASGGILTVYGPNLFEQSPTEVLLTDDGRKIRILWRPKAWYTEIDGKVLGELYSATNKRPDQFPSWETVSTIAVPTESPAYEHPASSGLGNIINFGDSWRKSFSFNAPPIALATVRKRKTNPQDILAGLAGLAALPEEEGEAEYSIARDRGRRTPPTSPTKTTSTPHK